MGLYFHTLHGLIRYVTTVKLSNASYTSLYKIPLLSESPWNAIWTPKINLCYNILYNLNKRTMVLMVFKIIQLFAVDA